MKHKLSITILLLSMFLVTQVIGLYVVNEYTPNSRVVIDPLTGKETIYLNENELPFGLEAPEEDEKKGFAFIVTSFIFAFVLIFILMKYKWKFIIRAWFFFVVALALSITLNAIIKNYYISSSIVALVIAVPLAYIKIFKPNIIVHNATELLIYPGIAAVFVPILSWRTIIFLLILISIYDAWAVWKSGIMQKMAKFQMDELKIFGGFLIPHASKKVKFEIQKIREKYKNTKMPKKIKEKKFKINLAILGGGDVIFPIITAGVYLREFGIVSALFIIAGAFLGLAYLFKITKKGKAYPAMPYITTGIFAGLAVWRIFVF
ncbi:MAG: hypothetical protein IH845_03355 [Nanoarchaeota archaeon]|nr:hypothetical protein [Nanoarchaeota archaeon]